LKRWVVAVALVVTAAACGTSGGATGAASPSPIPSPTPSPSPSPSPAGLTFKLNGVGSSASGTIKLIAGTSSVSLELVISGLQADSSHVSHIHVGSCQQRGNIAIALNFVVADGLGDADTRTTINNVTYPPASGTWYVVVHAGPDMQGTNANYLLCGNLFS
jgi:hypothetical protein